MGLQRETAGRGTLAIYSSVCFFPRIVVRVFSCDLKRQIVFAVMFEFIVFHTTPPALSVIGTLIIVGSAIYITVTSTLSPFTILCSQPRS